MSLPGGREDRRVIETARREGFITIANSAWGMNLTPLTSIMINRMAILHSYSLQMLQRIINQNRIYFLRFKIRELLLQLAKFSLGNSRYAQLRSLYFELVKYRAIG
jgi:hypothetical protein